MFTLVASMGTSSCVGALALSGCIETTAEADKLIAAVRLITPLLPDDGDSEMRELASQFPQDD